MVELTPTDVIDGYEMNDDVEIDAVVRKVDAVKTVGRVRKFTLFKFILDNMAGRQIQCCAWGDTSSTCSQMATLNAILHLEGARSKLIEANQRQFNGGNVNFELNINATTIIENLGIWTDDIRENQVYNDTAWDQLPYSDGQFVAVQAWIKTIFRPAQIDGQQGATGTITDGRRKLLVRVATDPGNIENIARGSPLQVRGQVLEEPNVPNRLYLRVSNGARIARREAQILPLAQLIRVNANVQREVRPVVDSVVNPAAEPAAEQDAESDVEQEKAD